ncbi:MAG TPA: metal-dependent transcriptional regulator [candidate division Zixibacteria bacterium]|nr:metal-dependent transcriptional regulator [candidate division Zixibacteria bacterium]
MLTESTEDYLKSIYALEREQGKVLTTKLAERLKVTPASTTGMLRKLADMKLVSYKKYKGVALTSAGKKIALEVIRHHRLLELYLKEIMGVPWDKVHLEAEKLEHAISEDLEDRIDKILGYPTKDPHGSPIPTKSGKVEKSASATLADLKEGQLARISEVDDEDAELLRYAGDLGLFPGESITVVAIAPFKGPITLKLDEREVIIGREAAKKILVKSQR